MQYRQAAAKRSGGLRQGWAALIAGLCALGMLIATPGCAPRAAPEQLLPRADAPAGLTPVRIFAVTDRAPVDPDGLILGPARGPSRYEDLTIGVRAGATADDTERDLASDFVTLDRKQLPLDSFRSRVAAATKGRDGNILVFVHGYNYSYQESVFRLAQLSAGGPPGLVPILFSWPSQAQVKGYVADRDAASYARDDLVRLLIELTGQPGHKPITLVGHSMGGWLVMESLRQLRLQGRDDVIADLEVALAAPDIDLDLFRRQLAEVGRLKPPLTVLVSADDRALAVSSRLGDGRPRLGAVPVNDPAIQKFAAQAGLRIVDISNIPASDAFGHERFTALSQFGEQQPQGPIGGLGRQLQATGAFILDATGKIIAAPFSISAEVLGGL